MAAGADQVQGFVHLLATSADNAHEPQVFRMRWDQPLKRFARAYATFREMGSEAEVQLVLSTQRNGELDLTATAGVYGLADGDQVIFASRKPQEAAAPAAAEEKGAESSGAPVAASSAAPAEASTGAAEGPSEEPAGEHAEQAVKEEAEDPVENSAEDPGQAGAAADGQTAEEAGRAGDDQAPGDADVPSSALVPAEAKARGVKRGRGSTGGAGRAAQSKTAGAKTGQGRSSAAAGKTPVKAEPKEDEAQSIVKTPKVKAKSKAKGKAKSKAKAKAKSAAAGAAAATDKAEGPEDEKKVKTKGKLSSAKAKAAAKAKAFAKGRPKAKAKAAAASSAPAPGAVVAADAGDKASGKQAGTWPRLGDPAVPRGNVRAERILSGPAKGWRVVAWLQEVCGSAPRAHDRMVRWRIQSPERTREFSAFKPVEEEAGLGVYTQIYTAVRPRLLKRIHDRRSVLEGITPPKARRMSITDEEGGAKAATTPAPRPRPPPRPAVEPAELVATQAFAPPQAPSKKVFGDKNAWFCQCDAHLRRDPSCVAGEQPATVHLRDYMLVGRGDSCDVVLNSRRTPQMISRCHAVMHREETGFALVDQGSLNGVLINGERVEGRIALSHGDRVTFGVPASPPEFDYIFEERPAACKKPPVPAQPDSLLATQLHQDFA